MRVKYLARVFTGFAAQKLYGVTSVLDTGVHGALQNLLPPLLLRFARVATFRSGVRRRQRQVDDDRLCFRRTRRLLSLDEGLSVITRRSRSVVADGAGGRK